MVFVCELHTYYTRQFICVKDDLHDYIDTSFFEKVFFRTMHNSRWMNSLASRLPDNTLVFPLDNTAQGIYTIGDIKKFLKEKEDEANP